MPSVTYTPDEVEALLRAEREATARATVRALRTEVVAEIRSVLGIASKQVLTTREAATVLGCGVDRVRQLVHDGELAPTERASQGGGWTFRRADVESLAGAEPGS